MNKQFFIGAGLVALVAIGLGLHLQGKHQAQVAGLVSASQATRTQVVYHQNKAREALALALQTRISLEGYKTTHSEELAALAQEFGVKPGELRSYLHTTFQARNHGTTVTHTIHQPPRDTTLSTATTVTSPGGGIVIGQFNINDGYLNLNGTTTPILGTGLLKVDWDYVYGDTLSVIGKTKKKWMFGKKTYFVDAKLENQKAKITALQDVQITEFKDKRFSIGPGLLYDPFSGRAVIGIGITYGLFRF